MNMSRSRFGYGMREEDLRVNYHFITNNNKIKYERHRIFFHKKPFTVWKETKQLFVQQVLVSAVEKWVNSRNIQIPYFKKKKFCCSFIFWDAEMCFSYSWCFFF